MQKFDTTEWIDTRGACDAFPVNKIDAYFPEDDEGKTVERPDAQKWEEIFSRAEQEDTPEEMANVFFCLHDPLACADELNAALIYSWQKMEALIITMQTGVDRKEVLEQIVLGKKKPENLADSQKLQEAEMMHKSLLLLYQTGYCSADNVKKYGSNLDKDRIEQLLGKAERKALREDILTHKNNLVNFLNDEYYTASIDEYTLQTNDVKLSGKARKAIHLGLLQFRVNAKDHVYNLAEENKQIAKQQDAGLALVEKELKDQQGILFEKIDIELKTGFDVMNRILLTWNTIKDGFCELAQKHPKFLTSKVNMLNGIRIFRNGELVVDEVFHSTPIQKIVTGRKPFMKEGLQMVNISEKMLEKRSLITAASSIEEIEQIIITEQFDIAFHRGGKLYDLADKLSGSKVWGRFITGIAVLNFARGLYELFQKEESYFQQGKKVLNAFAGGAAVLETGSTLNILSRKISKEITEEIADELLKGLPKRACVAGIFAGAVVDGIDSGMNFYKGDNDAAAFQALAAMAGTLGGVGLLMEWNPVGWVASLAAGVLFATVAIFLEDEPLEELSKNCQFRQDKKWIFWDSDTLDFDGALEEVIKHHLKEGGNMVSGGFDGYKKYSGLYEKITDILFGGTVLIEAKPHIVSSRTVGPTTIREYFKKELYVNIQFNMAKMAVVEPDLKIYLYPNGFREGERPILLHGDEGNVRIITQENPQSDFFVALFDIPEEHQHIPDKGQYRTQAEVLVMCRCKDYAHTFPIDRNDMPRYVAVREKLYKESTEVQQPNTPFNSRLNAKMEMEHRQQLFRTIVGGKRLKRDFLHNLLSPSEWTK